MPSSTFTFFHDFSDQLGKAVHDFSTHTFKAALTNTAPTVATDDTLSDITQIAASGGYTAGAGGGYTLDGVTWTQSSNVTKLTITDEVITAAGGSVGPFRYIVVYNDTATSPTDALVGYLDYGSNLTLADTESLTLDFDGTNGLLTITV
jgi:hypothetical protein